MMAKTANSASASTPPQLVAISIELARRAAARTRQPSEHTVVPYVIRVSNPLTAFEKLQLKVACLLGSPIAIMPHACKTTDEWMQLYQVQREPGSS
jgi:hypothetical protein